MKFLNKQIFSEAMTDKAATGIVKGILKSQNGFAKWMHSVTKNWKGKQQRIFLYLVCLCFGGLSMLAIVNPIGIQNTNSGIIPKSIAVPKNVQLQNKGFAITQEELRQVQEYKAKNPKLHKERPGLFDSLSLIEEVYYSQKK